MSKVKIVPVSIVIPIKDSSDEFHIWMQERESDDELEGLLEFPGGKVESDEVPLATAVRELEEETGVKAPPHALELFKIYNHIYSDKQVNIYAFLMRGADIQALASKGWHKLEINWPLFKGRIPAANEQIFADLVREFFK